MEGFAGGGRMGTGDVNSLLADENKRDAAAGQRGVSGTRSEGIDWRCVGVVITTLNKKGINSHRETRGRRREARQKEWPTGGETQTPGVDQPGWREVQKERMGKEEAECRQNRPTGHPSIGNVMSVTSTGVSLGEAAGGSWPRRGPCPGLRDRPDRFCQCLS